MNCPNCKSDMNCSMGIHDYKESGLNNILLTDVEICTCECGEKIVSIPCMPELHNLIGKSLIQKNGLLNGREIRFLRLNMGYKAKILARIMGVDNATISRWEKGVQKIKKSNDRFLRLVYCNIKGLPAEEIKRYVTEDFPVIKENQKHSFEQKIDRSKWINKLN